MKIYDIEASDGLTSLLEPTYGSCKLVSEARISQTNLLEDLKRTLDIDILHKLSTATNEGQPDLHFINTLLVSVGWNLNDDVFANTEVWEARHTPEDKPFNFQHDETDIIGHIVSNHVIDVALQKIKDDADILEEFHIVTSVALYKHWETPELQDRMNSIIADIPEGKWFVSMEALFDDFDYAVISPDGQHSIVSRTEASAYLTKHLRAYGGTGDYKNFKVGRLLRNLIFKGEGLVEKPANPQSVIFSGIQPFHGVKANRDLILSTTEEKSEMSDNSDKLQSQLAEAQAQIHGLTKELAESGVKALKDEVTTLNETVVGLDKEVSELSTELATAKSDFDAKDKELKETVEAKDNLQTQLEEVKAEVTLAERVNTLIGAGLSEEDAKKRANALANVDDVAFALFVELVPVTVPTDTVEATSSVETPEVDIDVDPVTVTAGTEVEQEEDVNLSVDETEAQVQAEADLMASVSAYLLDEETN